jgi:hypothetical protein
MLQQVCKNLKYNIWIIVGRSTYLNAWLEGCYLCEWGKRKYYKYHSHVMKSEANLNNWYQVIIISTTRRAVIDHLHTQAPKSPTLFRGIAPFVSPSSTRQRAQTVPAVSTQLPSLLFSTSFPGLFFSDLPF